MVNKKIYSKTHSIDEKTTLNNIRNIILESRTWEGKEKDKSENNISNMKIIQKEIVYNDNKKCDEWFRKMV